MMPFQHRWQRNGLRTVLICKQSNALKYPAGLERMQQERVHNYMHFVIQIKSEAAYAAVIYIRNIDSDGLVT